MGPATGAPVLATFEIQGFLTGYEQNANDGSVCRGTRWWERKELAAMPELLTLDRSKSTASYRVGCIHDWLPLQFHVRLQGCAAHTLNHASETVFL